MHTEKFPSNVAAAEAERDTETIVTEPSNDLARAHHPLGKQGVGYTYASPGQNTATIDAVPATTGASGIS